MQTEMPPIVFMFILSALYPLTYPPNIYPTPRQMIPIPVRSLIYYFVESWGSVYSIREDKEVEKYPITKPTTPINGSMTAMRG